MATDIRAAADLLDTAPVADQHLTVLHTLPPITFGQSRFWRYQLAECATRLAEDIKHWVHQWPAAPEKKWCCI